MLFWSVRSANFAHTQSAVVVLPNRTLGKIWRIHVDTSDIRRPTQGYYALIKF